MIYINKAKNCKTLQRTERFRHIVIISEKRKRNVERTASLQ